MKALIFLIIVTFLSTTASAREQKKLNKSFKVEPNKMVEIKSISGLDIDVKSWEKDEILFDLRIEVSSSDNEFEEEYVRLFDVVERRRNGSLVLEFIESDEEGGWSIWDLFKGVLNFKFSNIQ